MLKFFRKTRQKMLNENKFSKYLTYAFGEIILVVIGILIALQINNNNNYKNKRASEEEYLISLKSEFELNLRKVNESIEEGKKDINSVKELLRLFNPKILKATDDKELSQKMYNVFSNGTAYQPSTGVVDDIIASGNLNLILNNQLRQHLASFKSSLEFFKIQKSLILSDREKMLHFLCENGSIRNVVSSTGKLSFDYQSISSSNDNRSLFGSTEFENYILGYFLTTKTANSEYFLEGIKKEIRTILDEIDKELEK